MLCCFLTESVISYTQYQKKKKPLASVWIPVPTPARSQDRHAINHEVTTTTIENH